MSEILKIGNYEFNCRLIVGSGKYDSFSNNKRSNISIWK